MQATARHRWFFFWVSLSGIIAILTATGAYADAVLGPSVMGRAANAVVLTPTTAFAETDVSLINLTLDPIAFGHVDPTTGAVVDGQFLVFMALDLGTAPLQGLGGAIQDLQGNLVLSFAIDASAPQFSAVFALGPSFTLQPNDLVVAFKFRASPHPAATVGAEGDVTLRLALRQFPDESLKKAPGMTLPIRYLIRDQLSTIDLRGGALLVTGGAQKNK